MLNPPGDTSVEIPPTRRGLTKRDFFLLPLTSILTVVFILGVCEIATRKFWKEDKSSSCTTEDAKAGVRFKPNCTVVSKNAEGPWTTYHYNDCGYRSESSCRSKPPGTVRVVILGSSVSQGLYVPYQQTYFAIAAGKLAERCQHPVDVQNLGIPGSSPVFAYRRVEEALSLKPDVVLYLLAPFDLEQQIDPTELAQRHSAARPPFKVAAKLNVSAMKRFESALTESRTLLVAQHYLFEDRETFLRMYLRYGDKADFLRQPFTPAWQRRFADLDLIIGDMADEFRAAGVPLVVIPVPSRAEAALLSSPVQRPGTDPSAFGRTVEAIAARHSAEFVDLMEPFSRIPESEKLFYVVDGHITVEGEKVIAENLLRKLEDGTIPAFAACAQRQGAAWVQ